MRIKKAYVFFVFLAALIFNAHMIIPHDHHQAESDRCQTSVPFQNDSSHHHGFPVHCHAFNDLATEEAVLNSSFNHFLSIQFVSLPAEQEAAPVLFCSRIPFFDDSEETLTTRPSDFFSLRAPPTLI